MKATAVILLLAAVLIPGLAAAEEKYAAETNMDILAEKIKADKKLVVAANMDLTDAEAEAFWPLYEEYQKGLQALNERSAELIMHYAEAWNADNLTDEKAMKLMKESITIDEDYVKMRKEFAGKLAKAMPGMKAVRYMQIENKIRAIINYEIAAEIPLVE